MKPTPSIQPNATPPDATEYHLPVELDATPHPVVEAERRSAQVVAQVMGGVSRMLQEHMQGVKLELRALSNDNAVMRQNLALLNTALGDFQRLQVIPLRETLEHLRDEQGSVVIENARNLERLIQALSNTIAAAGGLIPEDLKAQIKDGRFENLPHVREGEQVHIDQVQAMIEEAYARGRADAHRG